MTNFKKVGCVLIISFFYCLAVFSQGLGFQSNDSPIGERTSYTVFGNNLPTFTNTLAISFDLYLANKKGLGYIFRLNDSHSAKTYSLKSFIKDNQPSELYFNIESEANKIKVNRHPDRSARGQWMHINLLFDMVADSAVLMIDSEVYKTGGLGLDKQIEPKIVFGKDGPHTDVPDMIIKNLKIGNKEKSYFFPLSQSNGTLVRDSLKKTAGQVDNPVWMLTKSYYWEKRFNYSLQKPGGCSFNPQLNCFLIFTNDSIIYYYPDKEQVDKQLAVIPIESSLVLGENFYNTKTRETYSYELWNDSSVQKPNISAFDYNTRSWHPIGKAQCESELNHHALFQTEDGELYIYGGYGNYLYSNKIFHYNQSRDQWEAVTLRGNPLPHRYYSASNHTPINDKIYFFGGIGNTTGEQIIGGKQFYDCYEMDINTFTVKKLWENKEKTDFVPANNLIFSKDGTHFYTACYNHYNPQSAITMNYYDVSNGSRIQVGDSIPLYSDRIETNINLYYSSKSNQFFIVSHVFKDKDESNITIYSINNTPIPASLLTESEDYQETGVIRVTPIQITLIGLGALLIAGILFLVKKYKVKIIKKSHRTSPVAEKENTIKAESEEPSGKKKNCVLLFGTFDAFDEKGNNIAHLFSPQIRMVCIQILVASFSKEKGFSSYQLTSMLWPEEEAHKIKNRKGVLISALRKVMQMFKGIELEYANNLYSFKWEEPFYCDYIDFMSNKDNPDHDFLPIIERGNFLTSIHIPEFDQIKAETDSIILEKLENEIEQALVKEDFILLTRCASLILKIDPFNESALKWLLQGYMKTNHQKEAVTAYDSFCSNYLKNFGSAYTKRLNDILKQ